MPERPASYGTLNAVCNEMAGIENSDKKNAAAPVAAKN